MPSLLDYNSFCEELKEVTSVKALDKKKFHANGLFSEQIFGPVKNYTCQCGTYYGISKSGGTCSDCGVDILNSDIRRKRFAKIVLPIPVINPIFFDLINHIGGNILKEPVNELMKNDKSGLYIKDDEYIVAKDISEISDEFEKYEGLDAIQKIVHDISEGFALNGDVKWKILYEKVEHLFINQIIVLPPELRPTKVIEDRIEYDEINKYYQQILTKKFIMEETIVNVKNNKTLFYNYYRQLQKDVFELYEVIIKKLSKKEGLIRGNILGKRIDFSGRAIIAPDPTLNIDQCSLPYIMFLELFKLQVAKKLILVGKFRLLNEAIDFVDDCIDQKQTILFRICEDLAKEQVCILNRQPSLHRLSMVAFYTKVTLDDVIKIHPLVCPGFNADFDGDQMAVYVPITEESKQEIIDKILVTQNLSNPSDNSLATTPSQDIILGIYTLTNGSFKNLIDNKVIYKNVEIPEAFKLVNECFPEDFPLQLNPIGKRELINILNLIKDSYPHQITAEVLDNIKRLGFKYSTLFGATMSLDEFELKDSANIKNEIYKSDNIKDQLIKLSSNDTEVVLKNNFNYSYMIESGARGSWDQARQIILTRGFISNFNGQIIPEPIKSSLIDGLTEKEFFNSTYGCRKGLLDVALNTGASGYLSRKLIFACANLQISKDVVDCGTNDMLDIYVKDEKMAKMLIGRWYNDNGNGQDELYNITYNDYKNVIGKNIWLRSPIFCKDNDLCHTCYGKLYESINTRFVGVVAAQSLGECNTQLVLRTFHTSGVAKIKDSNSEMTQMDIVSDLSMASKLLHSVESNKNYADLVVELFNVYNSNRKIHLIHFECIVSQLMWVEYKKWRLLSNRDELNIQYYSIQKVPSMESWLLGLAFSNPKRHILNGILERGKYKGIMDKILCGEKI